MVDDIVHNKIVKYGINTGFGNFKDVIIPPESVEELQVNLIRSHASGVGENLFGGNQNTTRAMLMTILARMDGQDVTGGSTWYEKAMNWAKANGVSDGTMPEVNITREQLATMLYSYAKLKGMNTIPNGMALSKFSDADSISTWASEAVSWAAYSGIISGRSNGTVDPQAGATRAEMAVMLQQFVGLMEK